MESRPAQRLRRRRWASTPTRVRLATTPRLDAPRHATSRCAAARSCGRQRLRRQSPGGLRGKVSTRCREVGDDARQRLACPLPRGLRGPDYLHHSQADSQTLFPHNSPPKRVVRTPFRRVPPLVPANAPLAAANATSPPIIRMNTPIVRRSLPLGKYLYRRPVATPCSAARTQLKGSWMSRYTGVVGRRSAVGYAPVRRSISPGIQAWDRAGRFAAERPLPGTADAKARTELSRPHGPAFPRGSGLL